MATLVDIIEPVAALLAHAAPTTIGRRALPRHAVPPRYVWVPEQITQTGPGAVGGNPRSLGDDLKVVAVHCWGHDLAHAERLRQALLTALRQVVGGRNYEIGTSTCEEPEDIHLGYLIVVSLTVRMPLPEALFPTAQGDPIRDNVQPTAQVLHVGLTPKP